MKTVLVLILSCDLPPYDKMLQTQRETWDSVDVDGVETIFYSGGSKANTDKVIYFDINESLFTIGLKSLAAYQWALNNKRFDYIARAHSSMYVNKKKLIEYVQTLPDDNVFAGALVNAIPQWIWGGVGFLISRDVVENIVNNKSKWDHNKMEDEAMSLVVSQSGIPFTAYNKACSIDRKADGGWQCISYCNESMDINNFADLNNTNHFFYRVKQDGDRETDLYLMKELFKALI